VSDLYQVRIHCVLFAADISANKKFVLSIDKEKISFPCLELSSENIKEIDYNLVQYLKQYIFVNELELLPQLISLHNMPLANTQEQTLDVVYGFVVGYTENINSNAFWHEFDFLESNEYTNTLLEVIQKLK
jgi:hypothetical protein